MDITLFELPFFPEGSSLSELPFFCEDSVENSFLPPRPSTVCDACWEGPFAMHLGLPLVSPRNGQLYRRWLKEISYSTSLAKLQSRADGGCAWCRLVLRHASAYNSSYNERVTITVKGSSHTSDEDSDQSQSFQKLTVHVNNPAAAYIRARSPLRDVGSPRALAFARQHLDECVQGHEQCCTSSATSPGPRLPTRLLDCTDLARPRLIPTSGGRGEYLALSYVWGGDQVHKTTKANISTYEDSIVPSLLPRTIRDAIYVTHTLGFRWLWVDSLCIVQDSDEDKRREISRMHHIYRYARLTIMAGSATDVRAGFLQERPPPDINPHDQWAPVALPFICPLRPTAPTPFIGRPEDRSATRPQVGTVFVAPVYSEISARDYSFSLGRMATRAWCMQEYLMSPRALIFTPATLLFRCLSPVQGVGNSVYRIWNDPQLPNSLFLSGLAAPGPAAEPDPKTRKDVHTAWMAVVENYTRRAASDESDKLVACAAVAEQFHHVLGSEYLAGLWRSDLLLAQLLWAADKEQARSLGHRHTRPTAYRAPSWSWAAIDGATNHRYSMADLPTVALAEVAECWVTREDPALPFGRAKGGALVLRGTPIPFRGGHADRDANFWGVPLPSFDKVWPCQWQRAPGGLVPDKEDDAYWTDPRNFASVTMDCDVDELPELWLVPLVWQTRSDGDSQVHGIVLELAQAPPSNSSGPPPEKTRFRRIGHFYTIVRRDSGPHSLWDPLLRAVKGRGHPWTDMVIV
ncbi:hypothetical protein TRAPUB_13094 [Trametes pubescens]|uniref:Heterokaryon incompatibility domain-containing protein n=1 Tax=Trametes pubescens TaxID=154538 RepID=A0A1M2VSD6_TRAPU|nr:hypothetical protein TRAPUB_13094 [Trametes pubescens]